MWRKKSNGNKPVLAGADAYDKQVPVARCILLWGGLSEDGFAPALWRADRKTNKTDWSDAVRAEKSTEALRFLNSKSKAGPWTILCDGGSVLRANFP